MQNRRIVKKKEVVLTDGIITLRPFNSEDAEAHVLGDDEESVKWLNDGHSSTVESTRAWIERNRISWDTGGSVLNFAIENAEDKTLLGMIEANLDFKEFGYQEGDANISYALYPLARGKGYITRSLHLMLEFLKEKGVRRAVLQIHPDNGASLSIPTRHGFAEQGTITKANGEIRKLFVKSL